MKPVLEKAVLFAAGTVFPVAAVALGQCRIILSAELARSRPLPLALVAMMTVLHAAAVILAAVLLPRLCARGRYGRAAVYALIAAFALIQFFAMGWWFDPGGLRIFVPAAGGGLIGAAIWVFFSRVPGEKQPLLFCLAVAAGAAGKIAFSAWARSANAGDAPAHFAAFSAVSALAFALILAGAAAAPPAPVPALNAGRKNGGAAEVGWTVAALFVFCLMNGVLLSGLFPLPVVVEMCDSLWTAGILLAAPLLAGWMLRRNLPAGYARIVTAGSVFFLAAATFSAAGSKSFFPVIHVMATAGQALVYPAMMLVLAMLAREMRLAAAIAALPYIAAIFTGLFANGRHQHLIGDASLTALVSLLLCMAFHRLARKANPDAAEVRDETDAPPSEIPHNGPGQFIASHLDKLQQAYDLSPREREIVAGLVGGMSNDEIAADLHIARVTVETHIQSILKKTNASNRHGIKKALFQEEGEKPYSM